MTDKERYKRTFSRLHASDHCLMEVETMKIRKIAPVRRMISVCAAAVLIAAMATVAYAADLGGIQRTVQVWIHGDQTNAVLELSGGSYTLTYDEEGEQKTVGGGGVSFDIFGNERPLTEEEIMEFCQELPRYKRPRQIIFAPVPRNPTGKIEKPVLRERYCHVRLVEAQTSG